MRFGRYNISLHILDTFGLDGGAMFGAVPKNLWNKTIECDEQNRIPMVTRVLLAEIDDGSRRILVDLGLGDKWDDKGRRIYNIKNNPFEEWGFDKKDITDVVLTHMHFDHCGWISSWKDSGREDISLNFKHANFFIQKANVQTAKKPNIRERASYLKENVCALDQLNLNEVDGTTELFPDFIVHRVDGHTMGQQWIEIKDPAEDRSIIFATDLIPTSHHLPLPFHMGYDMCVRTLLEEKKEVLEYALHSQSIIVFEHDHRVPACTITLNDRNHYVIKDCIEI